jgi:hypothetical protein
MKRHGGWFSAAVVVVLASSLLLAGDAPKRDEARTAVPADDAMAKAELNWAKGVALDFLQAVTGNQQSPNRAALSEASAMALLTPEFARLLETTKRPDGNPFERQAGYSNPKITSEALAPNGSEATFVGMAMGVGASEGWQADFKLRLVKETSNGSWSIRFFLIQEHEPKGK